MSKKQKFRSKEELIKDLKDNKKFQEKMSFTRDKFYPALARASRSIDDAQQQLYMINTMVMQKFLGKMKEFKFKDMGMVEILSKEDSKYHEVKEMLELFDDYSVFDAKDIMEGMKSEITLFLNEENKSRSLEDLKTKWIDQL